MKLEIDVSGLLLGIACCLFYRVASSRLTKWTSSSVWGGSQKVVANSPLETVAEPSPEPVPESQAPVCSSFEAEATLTAGRNPVPTLRRALGIPVVMALCAILCSLPLRDAIASYIFAPALDDPDALCSGSSSGRRTQAKQRPLSVALKRQRVVARQQAESGQLEYRSAYYGTLRVGTPAIDYTFVFDTGSGHLIVPSAYCKSATCRSKKRYRRTGSTSGVDMLYDGTPVQQKDRRDQITVNFGTGAVSGVFVEETVCLESRVLEGRLANASAVSMQGTEASLPPGCAKMRMISAFAMSEDPFSTFDFDGIVGLGLSGLSTTKEFNFLHAFAGSTQQFGSNPMMFAIFLGPGSEDTSEITLGDYNDDHLEGALYWNRVEDPTLGHWMVRVKSVRVDDQVLPFCNEGCKAVMDTGTSLVSVPSSAFSVFYKALWHRAALDGECEGSGPQIHFELDNFTITLGPEDYARPEQCQRPSEARSFGSRDSFKAETASGTIRTDVCCKPMLMSVDMEAPIGPKLFLLGEPVLRKYYTAYDAHSRMIGIGKARHVKAKLPSKQEPGGDDDSWFYEDDAADTSRVKQ